MILQRLLVREKLNLLTLAPLLVLAVLAVPLLAQPMAAARVAGDTERAVARAGEINDLVHRLQEARLRAVAYLGSSAVPPGEVLVSTAAVRSQAARLREAIGADADTALLEAVDAAVAVEQLRPRIVNRSVGAEAVIERIGGIVDQLNEEMGLARRSASDPEQGEVLRALDALLLADEAGSRAGALLLASRGSRARPEVLTAARSFDALDDFELEEVEEIAPGSVRELVEQAADGRSAEAVSDLLAARPLLRARAAAQVLGAVVARTTVRRVVEDTIVRDVSRRAAASAAGARTVAVAALVVGVVLAVLLVWLAVAVGRSISRPLRRLTVAAGQVADLAQAELMRVADADPREEQVPRLAAVRVDSQDEVGELASAFNRVQNTAALLLERQLAGRRNVASMFASVGQRTTNLVGRQLAIVDTLERDEDDPDVLARLYRLDHLSTRLRRHASSLVVLSGGRDAGADQEPLLVADAVRAALGSIEEYQRVSLAPLPDVRVVTGVVSDVVLLLAELVENGVQFSAPRTTVEVSGRLVEGGCELRIVDHGLGMPAERIADENAKLRSRERLDLAPSHVLGLFVVGRLGRRHGIEVTLSATAGGGTTARVVLPASVLTTATDVRGPSTARAVAVREQVVPAVPAAVVAAPQSLAASAPAPAPAPVPEPEPGSEPSDTGTPPERVPSEGVGQDGVPPRQSGRRAAGQSAPRLLSRRVPGESLRGLEGVAPRPPRGDQGGNDPEEVRRLVDDVDDGLYRALTEVTTGAGRPPGVPPGVPPDVLPGEDAAQVPDEAAPSRSPSEDPANGTAGPTTGPGGREGA